MTLNEIASEEKQKIELLARSKLGIDSFVKYEIKRTDENSRLITEIVCASLNEDGYNAGIYYYTTIKCSTDKFKKKWLEANNRKVNHE